MAPTAQAGGAGIRSKDAPEVLYRQDNALRRWINVLWPSFIAAALAEGVFFAVVDPQQLYLFGEPVNYSRVATYSIGFFMFWLACGASSFLTTYFARFGRN